MYVRVRSGFWTHRKTRRLRELIGNDGFWVPIRLWSFAAEEQPDGDFSKYSAADIADAIRYSGDATSMLQALLDA